MAREETPHIVSTLADDPDMAELVEIFARELPKRAEALESAVKEREWDLLKTLAHQLKGAAPSYGYECIGTAAGKVEQHIKSGSNPEELVNEIDDLLSLCRGAASRDVGGHT